MDEKDADFEIYEKLWQQAEAEGAVVQYHGTTRSDGCFHPQPHPHRRGRPEINIRRPHYLELRKPSRDRNDGGRHLPPPDIVAETITLAHEFGHFLSWKRRPEVWEKYFPAAVTRDEAWADARKALPDDATDEDRNTAIREAARSALDDEQMRLIMDEEQHAWSVGRELLVALGFVHLDLFQAAERVGLHAHRYRLGLVDAVSVS